MKYNVKVEMAFEKAVKKMSVYCTEKDKQLLKDAMQTMYDLGEAEGFMNSILEPVNK